jgi:hypothetical protein
MTNCENLKVNSNEMIKLIIVVFNLYGEIVNEMFTMPG